jgi:alkanesulfonate monooxygenase SsuD/methylene tetrahydromethanopterin reductase-like flavin-dependent oxidoreductase (luciferase family)
MENTMPQNDNIDRDLATFMAVAQAVGLEEAKRTPTTADDEQEAQDLVTFTREHLAAIRRDELAKQRSNIVSGAIRPSILAMTRDRVLARLRELFVLYPDLQFCHREFERETDDDLRSALEDALAVLNIE